MKLPCDTVRRRLTLLNAGRPLDADLARHVTTCEECREELHAHRALWSLLGEYDAPSLDIDLLPRVEQRLEQRRRRTLRGHVATWTTALAPRPRIASAAVAAAGIIIGAWTGTMLATTKGGRTDAAQATEVAETYASIFEASPPGFLSADVAWDIDGSESP